MSLKPFLTATQLFRGKHESGPHRCFYCCATTAEDNPAMDFVKSSFTGLDTVSLSQWVCSGCIEAMQEDATIVMPDGDVRNKQKVRGYSWVLTGDKKQACTKSHREWIAIQCINPPPSPFVICLSDSGQKHLLYRSVVNWCREVVTVSLEGQLITYRPEELVMRLSLCRRVCAATGKPAMKNSMDAQTQMRIIEHFGNDETFAAWQDCYSEPLTQLAVWLCPPKEQCLNDYPAN
jgi:hypothetical protein